MQIAMVVRATTTAIRFWYDMISSSPVSDGTVRTNIAVRAPLREEEILRNPRVLSG